MIPTRRLIAVCAVVIGFAVDHANAQRDSPVWHCYLSPIEVVPNRSELTVEFSLHKVGGPHEHVEHQCYLLLYRKAKEAEILRALEDPEATQKATPRENGFFENLKDEALVRVMESKVAKRAKRLESDVTPCFSYKFKLDGNEMDKEAQRLGGFDSENVSVAGKSRWHNDALGLIVFVPVNDSPYATAVDEKLQQTHDFGRVMNGETSILYFKPLPYAFTLRKINAGAMVHIH